MTNQFMSGLKKMTYDKRNDILYVLFQTDHGNSYGSSASQGIEIMRDMDTDEITGLMVFSPKLKQTDRQEQLANLGYNIDLAFACQ